MKILFIGLGSIGLRHYRLLRELPKLKSAQYFALRSGAGGKSTPDGIQPLADWNDVDGHRFDIALICNPTSLHIPAALECAKRGMHLFLEKPIAHSSEGLTELRTLVREKKLTAYVAYPLRFHPGVVALRQLLAGEKQRGHVRYVVSSHLPGWRPGTDHLKSYSANRKLGGGVVLDLSHEFDLTEYLFGTLSTPTGIAGRLSDVTVDTEDFADALFRAGRHVVNLHMNFLSPHAERSIELDLNGQFLRLDLIANELSQGTAEPGSTKSETFKFKTDDMFVAQLTYFLDNLSNPTLMNNLDEASALFEKVLAFRDTALRAMTDEGSTWE